MVVGDSLLPPAATQLGATAAPITIFFYFLNKEILSFISSLAEVEAEIVQFLVTAATKFAKINLSLP